MHLKPSENVCIIESKSKDVYLAQPLIPKAWHPALICTSSSLTDVFKWFVCVFNRGSCWTKRKHSQLYAKCGYDCYWSVHLPSHHNSLFGHQIPAILLSNATVCHFTSVIVPKKTQLKCICLHNFSQFGVNTKSDSEDIYNVTNHFYFK